MTIVHRHNLSKERAVIVLEDITGRPVCAVIKRDEEILFQGSIKDRDSIYDMIDNKMFSGIVMNETLFTDQENKLINTRWILINKARRSYCKQ